MPITTESISPDELQRLMTESGLPEKLPDDFIPFMNGGAGQGQAPSGSVSASESRYHHKTKGNKNSKSSGKSVGTSSGVRGPTGSSFAPGRTEIKGPRIREIGSDEELELDDEEEEMGIDDDVPLTETIEVRPGEEVSFRGADGEEEDELSPRALKVFDTIIWTVPFGFLLLLLSILIKQQYAMEPTFFGEVLEQSTNLPFLGVFIYFTLFAPSPDREMLIQVILFPLSLVTGASFLFILERSAWTEVVRRTPPLGTIWIYTMVRLRLPLAVANLAIVYAFTKYVGLELKVF